MDGKPIRIRSPRGFDCTSELLIAQKSDEAKRDFALMGVDDNIIMPSLDNYAKVGIHRPKKEKGDQRARFIKKLAIKPQNAQNADSKVCRAEISKRRL